jgi:3-oxoacyl-[acyl-carrier protein] reductase
MSDRYAQLIRTPVGKVFAGQVGLPQPVPLERHGEGDPVVTGTVLLGTAPNGRLAAALARELAEAEADVSTRLDDDARSAAAEAGLDAGVWNPDAPAPDASFKALVLDATGMASSGELRELLAFFGPTVRRIERSGRVVVLGTPPADCADPAQATAQRALEGFVRSVGKEVGRRGATANAVLVAPGGEDRLGSTLRFLLSPRSAYVSGQVVRVGPGDAAPDSWTGRVALVTGASRGIGASIAEVLEREGATVVGVDLAGDVDLELDITADDAPQRIYEHLRTEHGGVDVVVHNAGITRDKTLGRMDEERWEQVIAVNLAAPERITAALRDGLLREHGRVVCVSSISGIAGNAGQTNYAASKAGVIGLVDALAPSLAEQGATINAVAPGFIETQMTAAMPFGTREAGRRMNSLSQGGQPVDVAEAVAWLGSAASGGVNGNVVRVCGQSLLGA